MHLNLTKKYISRQTEREGVQKLSKCSCDVIYGCCLVELKKIKETVMLNGTNSTINSGESNPFY